MGWRVGASRLPSWDMSLIDSGGGAQISAASGTMIHGPRFAESIRWSPVRYSALLAEGVERLLEASGVALLGFGQGLEPIGDLVETFLAGRPRHTRIHVGVFVGFAGDRGNQVLVRRPNRLARRGVADHFEEFEM